MSIRFGTVIICDHPDCDEEYVGRAYDDERTQRSDAQGNHWGGRKNGRNWDDLCPDHKEID